jgi:hypothetical protein
MSQFVKCKSSVRLCVNFRYVIQTTKNNYSSGHFEITVRKLNEYLERTI